eukprot:TRINITY_DN953_c0_g1_i2.p1 TRINITY_DN953_c0_g1~~TRINITY_DN953_c0_g1_i2.p1  ORF type:complete len:303 (-),score=39.08 TRINITY_DN953_c0_g1_i2:49-957(-)
MTQETYKWETSITPRIYLIYLYVVIPYIMIFCDYKITIGTFVVWYLQMIGIDIGYHRYFSHRSFKTSRGFQFILAILGCISGQNSPIWWASIHRHHHRNCEKESDAHSPLRFLQGNDGFLINNLKAFVWSHSGFLWERFYVDMGGATDFDMYPEIKVLDWIRGHIHYGFGFGIYYYTGFSGFISMFLIPTFISWNITQLVNSVVHMYGDRPHICAHSPLCNARNIWWLSFVMLGANWHNNHHKFPFAANNGIGRHQLDINFRVIQLFEAMGLVWDVKHLTEEEVDTMQTSKYLEIDMSVIDN